MLDIHIEASAARPPKPIKAGSTKAVITATEPRVCDMIVEVKGAKLLQGFRGAPACDVDALADVLVKVSHLAVNLNGQLAELDINPLLVLPKGKGVKAVDALAALKN